MGLHSALSEATLPTTYGRKGSTFVDKIISTLFNSYAIFYEFNFIAYRINSWYK